MSRAVRVAAVTVAVLALCAALAIGLAHSEPRYAGVNSVRMVAGVAKIKRGDEACQVVETVPAETAAIEVIATTGGRPGPPLEAEIRRRSGERVSHGRLAGGYGDGPVVVPIGRVDRTLADAAVCISSTGRGKLTLVGVPASGGMEINGKPHPALIRIGYRRAGDESAFALLPTIAHRLGLAKTTLSGGWTLWALLGLFLGSSALALWLVLARDFDEAAR